MQLLKQSTAATVLVGPVLDSSGTAVTSAVIGDFNITKNGTTAALASAATATHSHNGHYLIALTTGNTDTLGRLTISANNSAHAMAPWRGTVMVAAAFDVLITNGDLSNLTGAAVLTAFAGKVGALANDGSAALLLTQIKLACNVANEGALNLSNTSGSGYGMYASGGFADILATASILNGTIQGCQLAASGVEQINIDGKTLVEAIRIIAAMVAGQVSGAGTGTETFKGLDEATTRAVITVDASGNRTDAVYS